MRTQLIAVQSSLAWMRKMQALSPAKKEKKVPIASLISWLRFCRRSSLDVHKSWAAYGWDGTESSTCNKLSDRFQPDYIRTSNLAPLLLLGSQSPWHNSVLNRKLNPDYAERVTTRNAGFVYFAICCFVLWWLALSEERELPHSLGEEGLHKGAKLTTFPVYGLSFFIYYRWLKCITFCKWAKLVLCHPGFFWEINVASGLGKYSSPV